MYKHFLVILTITILQIINVNGQQACTFSCLSDALSDNNCVNLNENEIGANATINETKGTVNFQFDFDCNVTTYKIILFYKKYLSNDFIQNSIYMFRKIEYSNHQTNIKQLNRCSEKGRVLLQNIQTGYYEINVLNMRNVVLYENISYWQTSYIKQELDLSKTSAIHSSRNNGTELIFIIRNPILKSHPEFSLLFECENCPHHLSKEHPYNLLQDETDTNKLILNPKDNNTFLNISCYLEHDAASCVIYPISVGNYNIVINFIGDPYKCLYNKPNLVLFQNIVVKADELLQQPSNNFELIISVVLGTICVIVSFSVVMLIIKLSKAKNLDENTNVEEHVADKNTISEVDFVETKPCLLLLYARNSDDVMRTLSSFRNIFIHQGIKVFDIYDPDRLSEINEISFNWILNLTSRKDLKIILFLTPSTRNFSDLPQVQESVDTLYPFAMKHLLNQISNDSEFDKKIFVCHFSNDFYEYSDFDLFSPHLRFRVPDDVLVLLQSILNTTELSLNSKANNEYNKLKQNYEKNKWSKENVIIINHM